MNLVEFRSHIATHHPLLSRHFTQELQLATADGPHVPELPFTEHVPGAKYGGTAATMTFTGSGALAPFSAGGTAPASVTIRKADIGLGIV